MKVARSIAGARTVIADLPHPLGLVPTMGALHAGHLALLREARNRCAAVVVSLFVNPTQFGPGEDYERYPRNEQRDLVLAEEAGADLVFAPPAAEMYRTEAETTVHVGGPLAESWEGVGRPGHFDGVATIVTKLFAIVAPDEAFFGRKDAQQLALIRRVSADLDLPVEIVAVATMREADGLAVSSRNAYLDRGERAAAARLAEALLAGRAAAANSPTAVIETARAVLLARRPGQPRFEIDYVAVVDPDTFVADEAITPRSLLIAAARLGHTRLIDNLPIGEPAGGRTRAPEQPRETRPEAPASEGAASPKEG